MARSPPGFLNVTLYEARPDQSDASAGPADRGLQHAFSPTWTFDAVVITFIGGVGMVHGPVLGAALFVFLKE